MSFLYVTPKYCHIEIIGIGYFLALYPVEIFK
jgi:hypothetical protein